MLGLRCPSLFIGQIPSTDGVQPWVQRGVGRWAGATFYVFYEQALSGLRPGASITVKVISCQAIRLANFFRNVLLWFGGEEIWRARRDDRPDQLQRTGGFCVLLMLKLVEVSHSVEGIFGCGVCAIE